MAIVYIVSGTTYTGPTGVAKLEGIGGGGAGFDGAASTNCGCGAGGAAYAVNPSISVTNGATVQIGVGGTTNGLSGTATFYVNAATFNADFGVGATAGAPGAGGLAANCVPTSGAQHGGTGGTSAAMLSA